MKKAIVTFIFSLLVCSGMSVAAHAQELVKKTRFVIVNYDREGHEELPIEGLDEPVKVEYVKLPHGTEEIHATDIRTRMRSHDVTLTETDAGKFMASRPECVKVAACAPYVHLGSPAKNAQAIIECMDSTDASERTHLYV